MLNTIEHYAAIFTKFTPTKTFVILIVHLMYFAVSSKPDGIRAVDIVPLLREKCVILSGGRDKRGGPILTFPAHSNIDKLHHEDLKTVISYLTTVPR